MQSTLSAGRVSALRYLQEAAHPVVQGPEVARRQVGEELLPQQLLGDFSLIKENLLGDSVQQPAYGTSRFCLRHDPAPHRPSRDIVCRASRELGEVVWHFGRCSAEKRKRCNVKFYPV